MRCDELHQVASVAARADDASFLASRPGPSLLLMAPNRASLRQAIVVPVAPSPALTTLGRHPENDIVAPWPSISRRHALLLSGDDELIYLVDRGSANGTFLGKERLFPDAPRLLADGDEILFGSDLRAIFVTSKGLLDTVKRLNEAA